MNLSSYIENKNIEEYISMIYSIIIKVDYVIIHPIENIPQYQFEHSIICFHFRVIR